MSTLGSIRLPPYLVGTGIHRSDAVTVFLLRRSQRGMLSTVQPGLTRGDGPFQALAAQGKPGPCSPSESSDGLWLASGCSPLVVYSIGWLFTSITNSSNLTVALHLSWSRRPGRKHCREGWPKACPEQPALSVAEGKPKEANAWGNAQDMLTCLPCLLTGRRQAGVGRVPGKVKVLRETVL